MSKLNKEISRFLVVGVSAVITDCCVYFILLRILPATPSKAISFISGTVVAYIFNKYWTFEQKRKSGLELVRFITLYCSTLLANVLVNKAVLMVDPAWILLGFLCATATSTVLNFCGQKWWVFA